MSELQNNQPFIAADDQLLKLLAVSAPPSVYLRAVPRKTFADPLERLVAREFLLYGVQGETILVDAAAELLGTSQDQVLDVLSKLEKLQLLDVNWLDVTRAGGCLVHVIGTHQLVIELVAARDEIRANREQAVEQLLTMEERALLEEDKRLARQEKTWGLAKPLTFEGINPQDSSIAAIGARAKRYAEVTRAMMANTQSRIEAARERLADLIFKSGDGKHCFVFRGKRTCFAIRATALERLCLFFVVKIVF